MADSQPDKVSALYSGQVMHKRLRPFVHRFAYKVFSLYLDLDEIEKVCRESRVLARNRFNLFSFHDRDHGPRDGSSLRNWAEELLSRNGMETASHSIRLLCFPRVLGYVFNPLSIWFCFARDGLLHAVIYEVSNTFGERRCYLLSTDEPASGDEVVVQSCAKDFYVSPFIAMNSHYRFRLRAPGQRLSILIRQWVEGEELLVATQNGKRQALNDRNLLRAFFSIPLMSLKVIAAIHWQALILWCRGAKLQPRTPSKQSSSKQTSEENSLGQLEALIAEQPGRGARQ